MIPALVVFALTYILMLAFQAWRPWIALSSAVIFIVMGYLGLFSMDVLSALSAVDYNVLMMIAATMGLVSLFIESKMPPQRNVGRDGSGGICRSDKRLCG